MEISASQVAAFEIPAPEPGTQRAIAHFLDRETAKIDTLIAKQEALVSTPFTRAQHRRERMLGPAVGEGERLK
jgi:type I restriction enzyme S subunit